MACYFEHFESRSRIESCGRNMPLEQGCDARTQLLTFVCVCDGKDHCCVAGKGPVRARTVIECQLGALEHVSQRTRCTWSVGDSPLTTASRVAYSLRVSEHAWSTQHTSVDGGGWHIWWWRISCSGEPTPQFHDICARGAMNHRQTTIHRTCGPRNERRALLSSAPCPVHPPFSAAGSR